MTGTEDVLDRFARDWGLASPWATVLSASNEEEEDDGLKPLSDRLIMELTVNAD